MPETVFDYMKTLTKLLIVSLLALGLTTCGGVEEEQEKVETRLPRVDDTREDLILTWMASGGAQTAEKVADVPEEYRKEVRVQDPTIPPEEKDSSMVFLADLTRAEAGGTYKVVAVKRADYDVKRGAASAAVASKGPFPGGMPQMQLGPDGKPTVTMYSTTTCPVCVTARRWLIDKGIPYVEKDVGKDRAAAAEMAAKGKAQGVPTTGVPVFDVGGVMIPGFDKNVIQKLLSAPAVAQPAHPAQPTQPTLQIPPSGPQPPPTINKPLAPKPGLPSPPVPPDPTSPTPIGEDKKPQQMIPIGPAQKVI